MLVTIRKAKLSQRQRAKYRERGDRPRDKEQKDQWEIAIRNEPMFATALRNMIKDILSPKVLKALKTALNKPNATVESSLKAIPFLDLKNPDTFAVWNDLAVRLQNAYATIIQESSLAEAKRRKFKKEVKLRVPKIPVHPTSLKWLKKRSLTQAKNLSKEARNTVRAILHDGFKEAIHTNDMVKAIQQNIGLTKKQYQMVKNRRKKLVAEGLGQSQVDQNINKFTEAMEKRRAVAIARTETLDAQTQGLKDSWKTAEDEGLMPKGAKKKWVSTHDERLSDICEELDGQEVPVDAQFEGPDGPLDGPPAHPNCRSTMILVF